MPRQARKKSSTRTYHVVIKGADRQLLFEDVDDYVKYLDFLAYYKQECQFEIWAYCLMSNHVHLLIRHSNECALETIFRRLNTAYATWYNLKYDRTGFVQNGRFFSAPIEDVPALMNVARYIHYNPVNAGLEQELGAEYPWNSYHDYLTKNGEVSGLTDKKFLLDLMGGLGGMQEFHKVNPKDTDEQHLDIDGMRKRMTDDHARQIIYEISECKSVAEFQKLTILLRNQYIRTMHKTGVSGRQINRLTGTSRGMVERILKED